MYLYMYLGEDKKKLVLFMCLIDDDEVSIAFSKVIPSFYSDYFHILLQRSIVSSQYPDSPPVAICTRVQPNSPLPLSTAACSGKEGQKGRRGV
jgi:hypothetical protein